MIDTHFQSEQNQFWHLDTETILSPPLYILLESSPHVKSSPQIQLSLSKDLVKWNTAVFLKSKEVRSLFSLDLLLKA